MHAQPSLEPSTPAAGTPRANNVPPVALPTADELKLRQLMQEARAGEKYVCAVFTISPEPDPTTGRRTLKCNTFRFGQFPKSDFNECVRLLAETLAGMEGG